ncbi:MAG: hypothetical protein R6U50_05100 [Desulfobacterales bacterium]
MDVHFLPRCRSSLIGSLPVDSHETANRWVWQYSPAIPLWIQLPANRAEDMILQFLPGMPGLVNEDGRVYVDTQGKAFDDELVAFYEEYLSVTEENADFDTSRFALSAESAPGFYIFLESLEKRAHPPEAVKGQVTGPITLCTSVTDQEKTAVFYHDQLRDAAVKLISLKARWQVRRLSGFGVPVILFIDEPSLAGFGSSEFTSISKDQVKACLEEVIDAVHAEGGLAGVHVCANTDWSLILETSVDIVNFDAYSYFDRFILYSDPIKHFLRTGRILAWGIVPTFPVSSMETESAQSLLAKLTEQMNEIQDLGIDRSGVLAQSLITPSCGAGSLNPAQAVKVLQLTQAVSEVMHHTAISEQESG